MAFQVSAGIVTQEIDLTTVVPAVSTTEGAIAGVFNWGPVNKVMLIDSENTLVSRFGKPSNFNAETFFTAANFLAYGNQLYVVRAADANVISAVANSGTVSSIAGHTVGNEDEYDSKALTFEANVQYVAKFPGELGNSLRVSVCDSANQYKMSIDLFNAFTNTSFASANSKIQIAVGSNTANVILANTISLTSNTPEPYVTQVANAIAVGDIIEVGNSSIGKQFMKVTSVGSVITQNSVGVNTGTGSFTISFADVYKLSTDFAANTVVKNWEFFNKVNIVPGQSEFVASSGNTAAQDEMHIVVVDEKGKFTGVPGSILEVFPELSRATDAKSATGESIYYKNVLNDTSKYVWAATDRSGAGSNTAAFIASSSAGNRPLTLSFTGGANGGDEATVSIGTLATAYDKFKASETISISLLMQGKARGGDVGEQLANYIIDNVAEFRKDCVAFISPDKETVVNNITDIAQDVVDFFNEVRSSSYAVFDSGYKYQYDRYNDVYRWIPLNGDIAGLCVNTDNVRDPWFSPAGFNRGFIKNNIKLAFNPNQAERDLLYKNRVNPVVTFSGQGTVLYGDKTGLAKSSAFDRINVRRLFIILEKAISKAAQSTLFELNDEFTRATFKNMIEPYLRDIQGRRGITDFKVVCDESNNTAEVIDQNRFVGDIYIKPARSINFINLNFVAVRSSVSFDEIVGQF